MCGSAGVMLDPVSGVVISTSVTASTPAAITAIEDTASLLSLEESKLTEDEMLFITTGADGFNTLLAVLREVEGPGGG